MEKNIKNFMIQMVLLIIIITACSVTRSGKEDKFFELSENQEWNKFVIIEEVEVIEIEGWNKLYIEVRNLGDDLISFRHPYFIRIFIFDHDENKWEEIDDLSEYEGEGEVFESVRSCAEGEMFCTARFGMLPDIYKPFEPMDIRILVTGEKYDVDGNFIGYTGAYVDVTIPERH